MYILKIVLLCVIDVYKTFFFLRSCITWLLAYIFMQIRMSNFYFCPIIFTPSTHSPCNSGTCVRAKPPVLVRRMPGHFRRYSGCRGLVRRIPLLDQTRFGCHELKNKSDFRTKTVENHQIIFKQITAETRKKIVNTIVHANI